MVFTGRVLEGTGYISDHQKGFPAPPAKDMGLMGQEGKLTSHKGLVHPPYGPAKVEKERGRRKGKKGNRIPPSFTTKNTLP